MGKLIQKAPLPRKLQARRTNSGSRQKRLTSGGWEGVSGSQRFPEKTLIVSWFFRENLRQLQKTGEVSGFASKAEHIYNAEGIQKLYRPLAKISALAVEMQTGSSRTRSALTQRSHFGPEMLGKKGRSAPLYVIPAHGNDDMISPKNFFCILDLVA